MKKFLLGALFLASVIGIPAYAQTVQSTQIELSPGTKQELIAAITNQIQQVLLQMIGVLQQEIQDLLTAQAQQISQVQDSINTTATKTASVTLGSATNTVEIIPSPSLNFSIKAELQGSIFTDPQGNLVKPIVLNSDRLQFALIPRNFPNDVLTNFSHSYLLRVTTDYPEGFDKPGGSCSGSEQCYGLMTYDGYNYTVNFHKGSSSGDFQVTFEIPELGLSQTIPFTVK